MKDLKSFENEWLEVEVKPPKETHSVPVFLADPLPLEYTAEHESAGKSLLFISFCEARHNINSSLCLEGEILKSAQMKLDGK